MTRPARPELLSLLQTARESPDDIAPRLVVADWLEEHGDDVDRARAEYVRLSCLPAEEQTRATQDRTRELHFHNRERWLGVLLTVWRWVDVQEGFPTLHLAGRNLIGKQVSAILDSEEWAWVGHLRINCEPATAAKVASSPLLGHAGTFTIQGKPEVLREVFASPHLARVRHLDLAGTCLTDEGVKYLAASPHLGNVRRLSLGDNRFTDEGLTALAAATSLGGVRELRLNKVRFVRLKIGAAGVAALFNSKAFPALTHLNINNNHLDNTAAHVFATGPLGEQLESLNLAFCRIGAAGMRALADSTRLARLKELPLWYNPLGNGGVAALAESRFLGLSPELCLNRCKVGDAGVKSLADSPRAAALTVLRLDNNQITNAGARMIAQGPWSGLRELSLHSSPISDEGAIALASSPGLAQLRWLSLFGCKVGREGALAFARSPFLQHIERLSLSCNLIRSDGEAKRALTERFGECVDV